MTTSHQQGPGSLGALRWVIVVGVLLYGLAAMLAWPVRRAMRLVPGRQEKEFRAYSAKMNDAIPSATKLVQELGVDVPGLDTKLDHKVEKLLEGLNIAAAKRSWPEDLDLENPWDSAIEILERAKCLSAIDHNSDVNELKSALNPLLRKRGIKFDWTFLKEAEGSRDWNALKNENLLPSIGTKLDALGYVLARIDDGSDNYVFSLCTSESFSRLEPLAGGGYAVRRFSRDVPAA